MLRRKMLFMAAATALLACERASPPEEVLEPRFAQVPVLVERAWGGGVMWELVKPRPPGLGADADRATHLYIIAPVDPADPLSPPISVPGLVDVGARDHVVPAGPASRGGFSGIARSVPLQVPAWAFWLEPQCEAPPFHPDIAWDWVTVSMHPCGRIATVFAVRLAGEACLTPLASVDRVQAAIAQGLADPGFPDEGGPWPFAVRPITAAGTGRVQITAPTACVPPGPRGG